MGRRKLKDTQERRASYNAGYQKQYVKRYVFKLNTKHDLELIQALESLDNRSAWFKEVLMQEVLNHAKA